MTFYIYRNFIINVKVLINLVILQLILPLNFSKTDKSNIYGVDFYYSGSHYPRIDGSVYFYHKFDQINDYLNMIDNLLDQFDMMINKPK